VGASRRGTDHQPGGDLLVAQPLADQAEHLPFAVGQVVQARCGRWVRLGLLVKVAITRRVTDGDNRDSPPPPAELPGACPPARCP
jgi:hypothetical protein